MRKFTQMTGFVPPQIPVTEPPADPQTQLLQSVLPMLSAPERPPVAPQAPPPSPAIEDPLALPAEQAEYLRAHERAVQSILSAPAANRP